jgi:hypothetical protein
LALSEAPAFATIPGRVLGEMRLSTSIAALQPGLHDVLTLWASRDTFAYIVFAVFVVGLAASLLPQNLEELRARFVPPSRKISCPGCTSEAAFRPNRAFASDETLFRVEKSGSSGATGIAPP